MGLFHKTSVSSCANSIKTCTSFNMCVAQGYMYMYRYKYMYIEQGTITSLLQWSQHRLTFKDCKSHNTSSVKCESHFGQSTENGIGMH